MVTAAVAVMGVVVVVSEVASGVGSLAEVAEEDTPDLGASAAVNMEEGWAGGEAVCELGGATLALLVGLWYCGSNDDFAHMNEIVRCYIEDCSLNNSLHFIHSQNSVPYCMQSDIPLHSYS